MLGGVSWDTVQEWYANKNLPIKKMARQWFAIDYDLLVWMRLQTSRGFKFLKFVRDEGYEAKRNELIPLAEKIC
jgi:hypothetical protein